MEETKNKILITNCTECGENQFVIIESLVHVGEVDEAGVLCTYKCESNEIDAIMCRNCNKVYEFDGFTDIEFNN